jgi:hypothetical protein
MIRLHGVLDAVKRTVQIRADAILLRSMQPSVSRFVDLCKVCGVHPLDEFTIWMMGHFFFYSLSGFAGAQRQRKKAVHLHPLFPFRASVGTQHCHNTGDRDERVGRTSFGFTSSLALDHDLPGGEN